jgi:hypothetical protein
MLEAPRVIGVEVRQQHDAYVAWRESDLGEPAVYQVVLRKLDRHVPQAAGFQPARMEAGVEQDVPVRVLDNRAKKRAVDDPAWVGTKRIAHAQRCAVAAAVQDVQLHVKSSPSRPDQLPEWRLA